GVGSLWRTRDLGFVGLRLSIGALLIGCAWFLAAGQAEPGNQLVLVSLALLGALVEMYGVFGWIARGRQRLAQRGRVLFGTATQDNALVASAEQLVGGDDRHCFHRADCLLAKGRNWPVGSRSTHE